MKRVLIFLFAVTILIAADAPAKRKDAKGNTARTAAPKVVTIPAGAVQIGPDAYRYTAPDGKTRLYFKTPFGIMSSEETSAPAGEEHAMEGVTARADGDMVHFARPTPFGVFQWQKKKSELNDMERAVLEQNTVPSAAAQD